MLIARDENVGTQKFWCHGFPQVRIHPAGGRENPFTGHRSPLATKDSAGQKRKLRETSGELAPTFKREIGPRESFIEFDYSLTIYSKRTIFLIKITIIHQAPSFKISKHHGR